MALQIKSSNIDKPNYGFLIIVIIGIAAMILELEGYHFVGVIFPILGIGVVYLVFKDRSRNSAINKVKRDLNRKFSCPQCGSEIADEVKHEGKHGQPILYHCENCEVLWHTDSYSSS